MVILRFDFASQLRREPGRVINPIEVNFLRIISLLDLVVLSRTMKMILRKIGRMIASRVVVVEAVQTRAESMQSLWRLALPRASSREETVQAPDGKMYTEYTFPDGHTERDYW